METTAARPSLLIWGRRGEGGCVQVRLDRCENGGDKTAPKTQALLNILGEIPVGTGANIGRATSEDRALRGHSVLSEGDVDCTMSVFLARISTPRGAGPQGFGPRKAAETSVDLKRNLSGGQSPGGGEPGQGDQAWQPWAWKLGLPLVSHQGADGSHPGSDMVGGRESRAHHVR